MEEVKIDRGTKAAGRAGTIVGKAIGAVVVLATCALVSTAFVWVIVSMWRGILG